MDHIDTLVNRLRAYSQSLVAYKLDADFADACTEAADALEKLQAKLERVTRERDAAVEDVLDAAITPCTYCKHNPSNGGGCDMKTDTHDMYACWQWRGLKES